MKNFELQKSTKERVAAMLERRKEITDEELIKNIWYNDLVNAGLSRAQAMELVKIISFDCLTNPETIRRTRQKLQEDNPEKYGATNKQKGDKIRQEIKSY